MKKMKCSFCKKEIVFRLLEEEKTQTVDIDVGEYNDIAKGYGSIELNFSMVNEILMQCGCEDIVCEEDKQNIEFPDSWELIEE